MQLAAASAQGRTTISATSLAPGVAANGGFVVIGPGSYHCEVKRVTGVNTDTNGITLTLHSPLSSGHAAGEAVFWTTEPVVNVLWFGAIGNGDASGSTISANNLAFQAALDTNLSITGTGRQQSVTVLIPPGTYVVDQTLLVTDRMDLKLVGLSPTESTIRSFAPADGAVIETIGSTELEFRNFAIEGATDATHTEPPAVGFFMGRSGTYDENTRVLFFSIFAKGQYSCAAWYVVAAEANRWQQCFTRVDAGTPCGIWFDTTNSQSVQPTVALSATASCISNYMRDVQLSAADSNTTFVPIVVGGTAGSLHVADSYFRAMSDGTSANVGGVCILGGDHAVIELNSICQEGISDVFVFANAASIRGLSIRDCYASGTSYVLKGDGSVALERLTISGGAVTGAIDVTGSIHNSKIEAWGNGTAGSVTVNGTISASEVWLNEGNFSQTALDNVRLSWHDGTSDGLEIRNSGLTISDAQPGDRITQHMSKQGYFDASLYGSPIAAGARRNFDITVDGCNNGDTVVAVPQLGQSGGWIEDGLSWHAVAVTGAVRIMLFNYTSSSKTPASRNWVVDVWKH